MGDIIWTIYQNTDVFENAVQFIIHINAAILIQGRYELTHWTLGDVAPFLYVIFRHILVIGIWVLWFITWTTADQTFITPGDHPNIKMLSY